MLRRVLPLRVVVSLVAAFALIGVIVVAGILFRHRDSNHPTTTTNHPTTTTATTTTTMVATSGKGKASP